MQEDQEAKHVGIARFRHAQIPLLAVAVFGERILDRGIDRAGQRVVGTALVIDPAFERTEGADEAVQRLQDIAIHHARDLHGGVEDGDGEECEQVLVGAQQLFGDLDVAVGKFLGVARRRFLVPAPLPEEFAIQRAIHRHLAFRAATQRANLTAHARTKTARAASLTNRALHFPSIEGG